MRDLRLDHQPRRVPRSVLHGREVARGPEETPPRRGRTRERPGRRADQPAHRCGACGDLLPPNMPALLRRARRHAEEDETPRERQPSPTRTGQAVTTWHRKVLDALNAIEGHKGRGGTRRDQGRRPCATDRPARSTRSTSPGTATGSSPWTAAGRPSSDAALEPDGRRAAAAPGPGAERARRYETGPKLATGCSAPRSPSRKEPPQVRAAPVRRGDRAGRPPDLGGGPVPRRPPRHRPGTQRPAPDRRAGHDRGAVQPRDAGPRRGGTAAPIDELLKDVDEQRRRGDRRAARRPATLASRSSRTRCWPGWTRRASTPRGPRDPRVRSPGS